MEETSIKRVAIIFNKNILSESQLNDGLKSSWLLLHPHLNTISDVVSYVLHSFDLYESCPLGLILSMDGFVLPPFESTTILKANDVISVKRKGTRMLDASKAADQAKTYLEDEIVEKQLLPSGVSLLANVEFNEETGGCQSKSDDGEDEVGKSTIPVQNVPNGNIASKKRKASSRTESNKKKWLRQITPETVEKKQIHNCEHITPPREKKKHRNKLERDASWSPDITEKCTNNLELKENTDDLEQLEKNREKTTQASDVSERAKKVSRRAKRKMLQRMYKRISCDESKGDEKSARQQPVKNLNSDSGPNKDVSTSITKQTDEDSDGEGDLVPVVIRPGHIRFTRSGSVKEFEKNQAANGHSTKNGAWDEQSTPKDSSVVNHNQETSCWNNISNKRKGQKWGQEKQQTSSWNEAGDYNGPSSSTWAAKKQPNPSWKESRDLNGHFSGRWASREHSTSSWKGSKDFNGQSSNTWIISRQPGSKDSLDFDKLVPLIDEPKAGDIIGYRLLELSSTRCPELSSFRVGKVTSFEPESNKILLVPVLEYPLHLERKADGDDDDGLPPSVYSEDGSLEIDFPSLADVRILKRGDLTQSEATKIPAANGNSAPLTSKKDYGARNGSMTGASDVSNQKPPTPALANGKKNVWEEISAALAAKKSQLTQEDTWKKETSSKQSWSYRTLRSSAIGPTMAMLRAQNGV